MQTFKQKDRLLKAALEVRDRAYAPYSRFAVGAALLSASGAIFTGTNVENVSLGLTICAERAAVSAAIASGEKDFVAIGLISDSSEPAVPCGACRQVLAEFNPTMTIITSTVGGRIQEFQLNELLPRPRQGVLEGLPNV
jgi:cytidine deaminase